MLSYRVLFHVLVILLQAFVTEFEGAFDWEIRISDFTIKHEIRFRISTDRNPFSRRILSNNGKSKSGFPNRKHPELPWKSVTVPNARARKNKWLLRASCVAHCTCFGWTSCRNRSRKTSDPWTRRNQGFEVIVHILTGINKCYWLLWWLGGLVIPLARVRQRPCIRHHDAIRKRTNKRHCCLFVCLRVDH